MLLKASMDHYLYKYINLVHFQKALSKPVKPKRQRLDKHQARNILSVRQDVARFGEDEDTCHF